MSETYKDESKRGWHRGDGNQPNIEQLTFGCLQRIADSTELMSKSYSTLLADKEWYKKRLEEERQRSAKLVRSINSLRGHLTRKKKSSTRNKK